MTGKISIRIAVLVLIIIGLNLLYNFTFYEKDLNEKCAEAVEIRNSQKNTDIYYFGESSNVTYEPGDSILNSISEITNWFYPALKITNINKYATHGGIYKHWLTQIDLKSRRPKALIVTLNLRSFDASWIHSTLETQLQESVVLTRPFPNIINRFLLSLQVFDNKNDQQREEEIQREWKTNRLEFPYEFKYKTAAEWNYGMSMGTYLKPDGSWDKKKIELACHYIKGYAFNLDAANKRIRDFDEIADWCYNNKIKLYLNLMSENIDYADSLVGKELVFLMTRNRDYLLRRYNTANCTVVDNLELVPGKYFIDQNWTTEHYNYKGRMIIARHLAKELKKQFTNEYKKAY